MDRPRWPASCARGSTYRRGHTLSPTQARAWQAIVDCRTAALGGVRERCANCGAERHVWRSCRNRHCPQCQTRARRPGVRRACARCCRCPTRTGCSAAPRAQSAGDPAPALALRRAVRQCGGHLLELAAHPRWLGAVPGFSLVLHTWSQDLRMHLRMYALITCGGLDAEGRWRTPVRGPRFLFPVRSRLEGVSRQVPDATRRGSPQRRVARRSARCAGCMANPTPRAAGARLGGPAKPPPGGPAKCSTTLPLHAPRGISNDRLLGCDAGQVRLRVRDNGTGGKRTVSLPTDTFIGRFLRHVLPAGFKRLRHYGLLACGLKRARLAAARAALQTPAPQAAVIEAAEDFLARVSGRIRDAARTVGSGVGTRSRSSWLAGTIRPHRRHAVGMGRDEHSRPRLNPR